MLLVGLDEDHFPLRERHPLFVQDNGQIFFVRINDFPEIVRFFAGSVISGKLLVMYGHNLLDIEEIGDPVHIKSFCFFHDTIITETTRTCKIFRASFLRNIL